MSILFRTFAPHSDKNGQRAIETLTTRDDTNVVASRSYHWRRRACTRNKTLRFFLDMQTT